MGEVCKGTPCCTFQAFPDIVSRTTTTTTPVMYPFDLASAVDRPHKSRDAFKIYLNSISFAAVSRPGDDQPTVVAIGPAPLAMSAQVYSRSLLDQGGEQEVLVFIMADSTSLASS
jgi:hypothetical protein